MGVVGASFRVLVPPDFADQPKGLVEVLRGVDPGVGMPAGCIAAATLPRSPDGNLPMHA